jgi:hypothetical protein
VFIDCEDKAKGFEIARTIANEFHKQSIILIDKRCTKGFYLHVPSNLNIFEKIEDGVQHIKNIAE